MAFKTGKSNIKYKDGRTLQINHCKDCDKKIINYRAKRCRSCDNKTRIHSEETIRKISGINNHNYIDGKGYLPYASDFTSKLKDKICKRDNYTCQCCEMIQEEHFIIYGRDIEIHHIDYNKSNCDEKNLITLCKQCNLRANYNRDYWYSYFIYIMKET